jgi:hypothetical protein
MKVITSTFIMFLATGCSSMPLNRALGTPKNPTSVFAKPATDNFVNTVEPLYNVLLEASDPGKNGRTLRAVGTDNMRRYLGAGFALSDFYCARFFEKTDEAGRRRKFGRALTNDVGTVITTILGLAKAGESIVTGFGAATGLADSSWRNYDDSFVVSPDLANVQSLVLAAQDNFRARTLAENATLPQDYGSAQSVIIRYAHFCSFLGMKAILDRSATEQRDKLNNDTEQTNKPNRTSTTLGSTDTIPTGGRPVAATPAITPNTSVKRGD